MLFKSKSDSGGMHGLFYANIPIRKDCAVSSLGPHKHLIKSSNAYFLYTGTGQFEHLNDWVIPRKIKRRLQKRSIEFYLYEPGVYYDIKQPGVLNRSHYHEFKSNSIEDIRCQEFDVIDTWARKNDLTVKVISCDRNSSVLQQHYPNIEIVCHDIFIRGLYEKDILNLNFKENITKKFYCFNWRYTFHRHALAAFCTDLDCEFSWPFIVQKSDIDECIWLTDRVDYIRDKTNQLNQGNYTVDWNSKKVQVDVDGVNCPDPTWMPYIDKNSEMEKYFCGIITETRFAQPFPNISEKVLNAVKYKTPFVLVAPPNSLEYMRELGFKTFSDYWDESYDKIENHQDRLFAIKDVLEDINSQSLKKLNAIYLKMHPILEHNANVLQALRNDGLYLP